MLVAIWSVDDAFAEIFELPAMDSVYTELSEHLDGSVKMKNHEDSDQKQQCAGHDCQEAIQCIPDCPGKLQKARATQCGIPPLVRVVPLGLGEAQQGQGAHSEHHLSCDNDNGSLRYIKDE